MALPSSFTALAASGETLDFEALLSRDYQPSRLVQLQQHPLPAHFTSALHHHHHSHHHATNRPTNRSQKDKEVALQEGEEDAFGDDENDGIGVVEEMNTRSRMSDEQRAFVLKLVMQTPAFLKHLEPSERSKVLAQQEELLQQNYNDNNDSNSIDKDAAAAATTITTTNGNPRNNPHNSMPPPFQEMTIAPKFSPLELMDWESNIDWGDNQENEEAQQNDESQKQDQNEDTIAMNNSEHKSERNSRTLSRRHASTMRSDNDSDLFTLTSGPQAKFLSKLSPLARELLTKKRNPLLDQLNFDDTTIVGYGDPSELARKAAQAPLILELGVAGQSVAHKVYQSTVLSAQHPTPAVLQYSYQARVDREWGADAGDLSGLDSEISQNVDARKLTKQQLQSLIAARSLRREQMAKDKTNRVTAALGTLALGGGKGRAITSSLMGPGGTERTGRPSRLNAAGMLENEYIEQVELITSHSLVRDLSKVLLREFHRPKVPQVVVRPDLSWQFQIRVNASNKSNDKNAGGAAGGSSSSPFHLRSGGGRSAHHSAGPAIRSETDLSPSSGILILVEYSEERPPIQLSRGMCTKIINYYRGDKAHCPVSAGGGDRPARRKRLDEAATLNTDKKQEKRQQQQQPQDRLPRLTTYVSSSKKANSVLDWIGPLPKKPKDSKLASGEASAEQSIDILPEGVTEILHPNIHGPFLGEIPDGTTLTGLISNLFVAPLFRHEPESTDFFMVLTPPSGATRPGQRESMGVILRDFPKSVFTVGQTEPRTRVHAPTSPGEKAFTAPYISYQIARAITRAQAREGHGLRLDELQARVLPNLELPGNAFRQRLKYVAEYDKLTAIWTTKPLGKEGYQGVEALGRSISPEGVAAFETACAASRRLADLGILQLFSGNNMATSMSVIMIYLAGQLNALRELSRKMKRLTDISLSQEPGSLQAMYYEKAASEIEALYKLNKHKYEVAQFIYEELQLTPWHLTGEFIDVHKRAEGSGMMKLTGLGDPSGTGVGFSFIREVDTKPNKSVGKAALSAQVKKITGTEDDLRKLTMAQMASLLRSYGMAQKQIDTLKRWDRVHCIRDLSTKAADDGVGDGLERFARGEKLKLSEQKQMYRDRIQEIWRRQMAALSVNESGDKGSTDITDGTGPEGAVAPPPATAAQAKKANDSDSESDEDDDFADEFEQEMMDRSEANQLVAAHQGGKGSGAGLGQLRAATQDNEMSKDARDLFAFRRQREEEKAAQEGLQATSATDYERHAQMMANRKVIRKRITKTHPDGRQTTTFKFILHPEEVGKIEARLGQRKEEPAPRPKEWNYQYGDDEKPPGHAMFEDEDSFDYSSRGRSSGKRRAGSRKRDGRATPRGRGALQFGKLKTKVSKEERMRKRKREEEELEVYNAQSKRKTTNNRRERGSIRERRPHVIFADKLEAIRAAVEIRPFASPFAKPVSRKTIPRYYEVISNPIDLQTIRDKISRYEYRKADMLLKDFELMKSNAVKFNGPGNHIAQEASAIHDFVRDQINANRSELTKLEAAVENQMDPKKGGKKKKKKGEGGSKKSVGLTTEVGGNTVNLGDIQQYMDDSDSGSEGEILLGA